MKKTRFTESHIVKALKEQEAGRDVNELCCELGIHRATFYAWKKIRRYGSQRTCKDDLSLLSFA